MTLSPLALSNGPYDLFHRRLRSETRAEHDEVDTLFSQFDLESVTDYRRFLTAHAMVLPAIEASTERLAPCPDRRPRADALRADLAALAVTPPAQLWPMRALGEAQSWGAFYVIEGSRLGGALLAKRVGPGLPAAYLSAAHAPGQWRRVLIAIDQAAGDVEWQDAAVTGARKAFGAYIDAAQRVRADG